ncbi:TonB-dependent hemoglobin/transferrin/lactoferrin family receptor [Oleiharenicola lentus]|uniref:TonB-dependent hemoglobin/transferrin/lactoferrin family receptor n=1 Tax=Oleiharenicola lentus TaxID=2508720 RepID=UPI003F6704E1
MFTKNRHLGFATCLALAVSLNAQTVPASGEKSVLKLDDYVVTATRTARPINSTPGTVNVVNLDDTSAVTLNEVIKGEPLVSVPFSFSGAGVAYQRGGANSINIRGIEGNRVLLQVDGVRIPDEFRLGGSEPTGRDYFDPELYRRLEILQGSASALYGSDALGGVVTFTTKSPEQYLTKDNSIYVGAKAGYRSVDDGQSYAGTLAASVGALQSLVVYSRHEGHELENKGSVAPNPEDYASDAVLTKLAWTPSAPHRFELALENFERESVTAVDNKEVTSGTTTTTGLDLHSNTQRFRLSAAYTFNGSSVAFDQFEARVYSQDANTTDLALERITYTPASAANGTFRNRDITTAFNNDTVGFSAAAVKSIGDAHRLAYGVEGSQTDTDKPWRSVTTNSFSTTTPSEPRMAVTETDRLGAYVQDEYELKFASGAKLSVIPGVRVDQFKLTPDNSPAYLAVTAGQAAPSFDEVALSPKLGVVYSFTQKLNVYAQYNRGFRYPTAEDLTATFTNPVARYRTIPNPNLKEETSHAYEVGFKGHPAKALTVRTAVFYTDYKNFIEQVVNTGIVDPLWPSGVFQTQNRASARIYGAELWARIDLGELETSLTGFSVTASLGKSRGDYEITGGTRQRLTSVEPLKAYASLAYHDRSGRFGAGVNVEHVESGQPGTGTQFSTPSYTILGATVQWRATTNLTLRLGLNNLTDERYWRYASVRGVTVTQLSEQERRTEAGFNSTLSAHLSF